MTSTSPVNEHQCMFRKPSKGEKMSEFENGVKWRWGVIARSFGSPKEQAQQFARADRPLDLSQQLPVPGNQIVRPGT